MNAHSRLVKLLLALTAAAAAGCAREEATQAPTPLPRPFGHDQAAYHATLQAPYSFDDTIVRVGFDLPAKIVNGDETAVVRAKAGGLTTLPFNSVGITYRSITVDGKAATYDVDATHQLVNVHISPAASAGQHLNVAFHYWVQPQRGLFFVLPDGAYPHITPQIWTQGEPEDNRRWFPTWDEPNEKTPSELVVTVPEGWTVVGNGSLKGHVRAHGLETWDWDSPLPMATYLIAFVASPLSEHHTTLGSLNVDSFVQPPYADVNATCFGDTNQIVDFFQGRIGVRFPWAKEDQMTAERFTAGGMENTSATIQTALALHPASEEPESSCDALVSHELGQQWFGDDATMTDWANAWLHEGFATYFQELWSERRYGEAEFEYERWQAQQTFFAETTQYYRPIVDYAWGDPIDVFDSSSHERPGEVLHSLRWMFGDARFFRALRAYLLQYQYKNVDTHQFFAAIGKSLGANLSWFQDEWFYRPAYPEYVVDDGYDAATRTLTLHVRQNNHDGRPFRMPIAIEAWVGRTAYRVRPIVDGLSQTITISSIPSKPQMILFDPNNNVLRKLTFPKSTNDLAYQLLHAQHVGDREWALAQLANEAASKGASKLVAMRAVRDATIRDTFYGVRGDSAAVAASFGDAPAVQAALSDRDKRVVLAAEAAASGLERGSPALFDRLTVLTSDADPNVVAAAWQALGALHAPYVYGRLVRMLDVPSFYDVVAVGALQGLAAYGDARALPLLRARTSYGTQDVLRDAAIASLGQLAGKLNQPAAALPVLLQIAQRDPLVSSRMAATNALGALGDEAAIPALEGIERDDSQVTVKISAWQAILSIRDAVATRKYKAPIGKSM